MKIEILYEDKWYIAANKPSGLLVHSYKEKCGTQETLMRYLKLQTGHYLYPMHRLDRPVSGIVLFALDSNSAKLMQQCWRECTKEYQALCKGIIDQAGTFDFALQNDHGIKQDAVTHYAPLQNFRECTLVNIRIDTGRRHQIRRHFARRSHNIIGDVKHGRGGLNRQFQKDAHLHRIFLHASHLTFKHPHTGQIIEVDSPLPSELKKSLSLIKSRV